MKEGFFKTQAVSPLVEEVGHCLSLSSIKSKMTLDIIVAHGIRTPTN